MEGLRVQEELVRLHDAVELGEQGPVLDFGVLDLFLQLEGDGVLKLQVDFSGYAIDLPQFDSEKRGLGRFGGLEVIIQ